MSERDDSAPVGSGTAEIPVVRPPARPGPPANPPGGPPEGPPGVPPTAGLSAGVPSGDSAVSPPAPAAEPAAGAGTTAPTGRDAVPGPHPTTPVTTRPSPRPPRRGPLTVMGPWAPVAGGLLGLLLGVVAVLFLAGSAELFEERLALAFTVLGLGLLGTAGTLLADEVRILRQTAREVPVRPAWVEATAGLLNGLTPARLLLVLSGFVLFLAAHVTRG